MDLKNLLIEIKDYIEETEDANLGECGDSRTLEDIIKSNNMPDIYYKVCKAIENLTND